MTDPAEGISPVSLFSMALLERLQRFEMTDDKLREEFGLPPDAPLNRIAELEINVELVDQIAAYLIVEEELADEFMSSERERIVNIGMFIYGWEDSKHLNG